MRSLMLSAFAKPQMPGEAIATLVNAVSKALLGVRDAEPADAG